MITSDIRFGSEAANYRASSRQAPNIPKLRDAHCAFQLCRRHVCHLLRRPHVAATAMWIETDHGNGRGHICDNLTNGYNCQAPYEHVLNGIGIFISRRNGRNACVSFALVPLLCRCATEGVCIQGSAARHGKPPRSFLQAAVLASANAARSARGVRPAGLARPA